MTDQLSELLEDAAGMLAAGATLAAETRAVFELIASGARPLRTEARQQAIQWAEQEQAFRRLESVFLETAAARHSRMQE